MRRIFCLVVILIFSLSLTGCADKKLAMDELAANGTYHYQNKDLGFSLALPQEFQYYQTQRKQSGSAVDLEIFVPTSDRAYSQQITGYAKPITVRIYNNKDWQKLPETDENKKMFSVINEQIDKVYVLKFWQDIPNDWKDKWTEEMKQEIIKSFKII